MYVCICVNKNELSEDLYIAASNVIMKIQMSYLGQRERADYFYPEIPLLIRGMISSSSKKICLLLNFIIPFVYLALFGFYYDQNSAGEKGFFSCC